MDQSLLERCGALGREEAWRFPLFPSRDLFFSTVHLHLTAMAKDLYFPLAGCVFSGAFPWYDEGRAMNYDCIDKVDFQWSLVGHGHWMRHEGSSRSRLEIAMWV
jgi:hypothetical protein